MGSKQLHLSNTKITILVDTDAANNVRSASLVVKQFIGQPLSNLIHWMEQQGKTEIRRIER